MNEQVAQFPPYAQYVMVPVRERNGLGVVGFLIALVGLFIPTGIVAILGLLISLVALGRAPRGFAAVGVVTGFVGTIFWLVLTSVALLGVLVAGLGFVVFAAAAFILIQPELIEVSSDLINMTLALVEYEEEEGTLPGDIAVLGLSVSTLSDPWGNPYRYKLVQGKPGFDLTSSGADGTFDTHDDVALSRLDKVWESALGRFGQQMEELGERLDRLDGTNVRFEHFDRSHGFGHHKGRAAAYEEAAMADAVAPAAPAEPAPPEPAPEPSPVGSFEETAESKAAP